MTASFLFLETARKLVSAVAPPLRAVDTPSSLLSANLNL